MTGFWRVFALGIGTVLFMTYPIQAKRVPPQEVPPVVVDRIKYSASGDGRDAFVVATDVHSGNVIWKAKIFHIHIKPWVEEDNQWIFISDLTKAGKSLLIRDEKARCYSLDLSTRRVRKKPCDKTPDSRSVSERAESDR